MKDRINIRSAEARKVVATWINSASSPEERYMRKQIAFPALYSAKPYLLIYLSDMIKNATACMANEQREAHPS